MFTGQDDVATIVEHHLVHVIFARFLRVYIVEYHSSTAMRMEFSGCYIGKLYVPQMKRVR